MKLKNEGQHGLTLQVDHVVTIVIEPGELEQGNFVAGCRKAYVHDGRSVCFGKLWVDFPTRQDLVEAAREILSQLGET